MNRYFAIIAHDKAGAGPVRIEKLKEHLAHIEANLDRFAVAGPLRDGQGAPSGSLLVVKAASEAEARAFLQSDPYFAAGVWADIEVAPFSAVAGDWVGGKAW